MEKVKALFERKDVFAREYSIELPEVGPGTAMLKVKLQPEDLNGGDGV